MDADDRAILLVAAARALGIPCGWRVKGDGKTWATIEVYFPDPPSNPLDVPGDPEEA